MNNIGNVPVTTSVIASLYPELKSPEKKVVWLEKQGYIIRLKRGLYVLNPELSGKMLSTELLLQIHTTAETEDSSIKSVNTTQN